jgi:hypothetical protein
MEIRRFHHYLLKYLPKLTGYTHKYRAKYVIIPRFQTRKRLMLLALSIKT